MQVVLDIGQPKEANMENIEIRANFILTIIYNLL